MSNAPPSANTPFSCTIMTAAPGAGHAIKEIIAHPTKGIPIKTRRATQIWRGQVQHVNSQVSHWDASPHEAPGAHSRHTGRDRPRHYLAVGHGAYA
jgi:hypothetical protein